MTATTTGIIVTPDAKWDTALDRFTDAGLWLQPVAGDGTDWVVYHAESLRARSDGSERVHTVTVDLTDPTITRVRCSCEAGERGLPCLHAAGALREAGAFPVVRTYLCGACGYSTTDADAATIHYLHGCPKRPPTARDGAALLLGARSIVP